MAVDFNTAFDRCLDRIIAGDDLESVLRDYPTDAARLRPLLQTTLQGRTAYAFEPSAEGRQFSRRRFDAAMVQEREARRQQRPWFRQAFARPPAWAAIATIMVAVAVIYIGLRPVLFPGAPELSPFVPVASPSGNFAFLVSDEVNAIAEFNNVDVTINRIGLQQADGKWIEIELSNSSVDLTKVPGDLAQEIWRGDLPAGDFSQVFVYVDNVSGRLKSTGETVEIKLPSQKLHLTMPFTIADNAVTSFTYDMTVFRTGDGRNAKYILKPQVSESGARRLPGESDKGNGNTAPRTSEERPTDLPPPGTKPPKK